MEQQTEQSASGSDGSVITINGLAPAATYGPGTYTVVATAVEMLMEIVLLQQQ
jgi:hypothetical protein